MRRGGKPSKHLPPREQALENIRIELEKYAEKAVLEFPAINTAQGNVPALRMEYPAMGKEKREEMRESIADYSELIYIDPEIFAAAMVFYEQFWSVGLKTLILTYIKPIVVMSSGGQPTSSGGQPLGESLKVYDRVMEYYFRNFIRGYEKNKEKGFAIKEIKSGNKKGQLAGPAGAKSEGLKPEGPKPEGSGATRAATDVVNFQNYRAEFLRYLLAYVDHRNQKRYEREMEAQEAVLGQLGGWLRGLYPVPEGPPSEGGLDAEINRLIELYFNVMGQSYAEMTKMRYRLGQDVGFYFIVSSILYSLEKEITEEFLSNEYNDYLGEIERSSDNPLSMIEFRQEYLALLNNILRWQRYYRDISTYYAAQGQQVIDDTMITLTKLYLKLINEKKAQPETFNAALAAHLIFILTGPDSVRFPELVGLYSQGPGGSSGRSPTLTGGQTAELTRLRDRFYPGINLDLSIFKSIVELYFSELYSIMS